MIVDISHRHYRLPPDAIPKGRERHVHVEPDGDGMWSVCETDEGGGCFNYGLSKREAIAEALEWVAKCNATMTISNGGRP